MRGRVSHSLNYCKFHGGLRRGGMVGNGKLWTYWETTNIHEAEHTIVNSGEAVLSHPFELLLLIVSEVVSAGSV